MKVLITGGAGYIGAHIAKTFIESGHDVIAYDDLSNSDLRRINFLKVEFVEGSINDAPKLRTVLDKIDLVIHCAGLKSVEESEREPEKYHLVNYLGTEVLLNEMTRQNVRKIIFASTAAVYGNSATSPISEDSATSPVSIYGKTKLDAESLISSYVNQGKIDAISLRFFNAVGSVHSELGDTSTDNLFPKVFKSIDDNVSPEIFGDDYPTPDGTCIRDYIHVQDIADAHLIMSNYLNEISRHKILNLGTGNGFSVREIIDGIQKESGNVLTPIVEPRRAGDLAVAYADVSRVKKLTGWEAKRSLKEMIASAWESWSRNK